MSLNTEVDRRDVDAAFRVLDGDERASAATPDALALAAAARKQWRQARVTPDHVDFDTLDRAVLRAVAEERLRTNERRQVTRVLFPGLGLAAALAAIGLVVASRFGGNAPDATVDAVETVATAATPPQTIGVGTRLTSGEQSMAATVGVATVTLDARSHIEVLTDEPLLTRIAVGAGSVGFEVAPRPVGGRYEVVAGRVTVTVVGTGFRVSRLSDAQMGERVAVVVEHGVVLVRSADGKTVRLTRGESVTVPADDVPPAPVAVSTATVVEPAPEATPPVPDVAALESARVEDAPVDIGQPTAAAEVAAALDRHAEPAPRARALRTSPRSKKPAPTEPTIAPVIVVPGASEESRRPVAKLPSSETAAGTVDMIVETSEDDRLATARLRELVAGLGPATCSARVSGLRQWIAEQPGHGRLRIGQHALAYCYHALGRTADADRLFRRLGFKLKDILEPKPPAFR